jgi:hypothetical protein
VSIIPRAYRGAASVGKLTEPLGGTPADRVLKVANMSGWDFSIGTDIFAVALGRGTALEEKVLCTLSSKDATTNTGVLAIYVDANNHAYRGWDDTAIQPHDVDTTVEHIWSATDARESMQVFQQVNDPAAPKPPHRHGTWRDIKDAHAAPLNP